MSKYWSIETIIARKSEERVDYVDSRIRLRELLTDSVNMRLISDVPLGVFLSGGIDSTILTGLMARISNQRIMTFTVLFTGAGTEFFNEKEYADVVKSAFDTKHYEITIDISNPQELYDLIGCFDQPFGNPTFYLSYLISKYTREHVTVALSGAGGDELFAGYPRYRAVRYANLLNSMPGAFKGIGKLLDFIPDNFDKPTLHRLKLLFSGIDKDFAKQYLRWTYYFDDDSKGSLFAADFQRFLHGVLPSRRLIADRISAEFATPCDCVQYVDVDSFLVDNILEYTDKTSMAVALEVRVPFLDHRIVEESFRMPYDFKLKNGTSKYILKDTFKDLIPPRILSGKKRGFCPPLALWMRKELDGYFDSYLSRDYVKRQGFFNWDYIQFLRQQHKHRKRDNSMELFGIIMFDVWYRKYIA